MEIDGKSDYTEVISSEAKLLNINLAELLRYKDLIFMFVKRDFITFYKQTILGPAWILLQPLIMTLTFTIVFGYVAGLSTDGLPHVLFYCSGIIVWNFFSEVLKKTSNTFITNSHIFGKVYFPRLVVPISVVLFSFLNFLVQFGLFVGIVIWQYTMEGFEFRFTIHLLWIPYILILIGVIGMSIGLLVSSFTTKYRDLKFLLDFGIQLVMYISPVIYPVSIFPDWVGKSAYLNPLTSILEVFRYACFQVGDIYYNGLIYTSGLAVVLLLLGVVVFNKVQRNFMDTI